MMQSRRSAGAVMFFVLLFILQSASQLAINQSLNPETIDEEAQVERVHFNLRDVYSMMRSGPTINKTCLKTGRLKRRQ